MTTAAERATVAAVILAAGEGSRFAGPTHKLLVELHGRPIVASAVAGAADAGLDDLIVVTGAVDVAAVLPDDVCIVHNPDWRSGQAGSLQLAVATARGRGHAAIVVGLGDQPFVPASAWRSVADSDAAIATAVFAGKRRPPVRLGREVWDLLPREGDEGARALMRSRPDLVREIACSGEPADIDTLEDLVRWR